ncbi:MAG: hypothetical protein CMJ70_19220 [Planctomycetaceae bacterium]|nr:hypothetical protein [Planctomycetaceae bacterium]|tara:strand:- start:1369 stop:4191 length:2823 start_codon:yes stop_codon:yes gene_type:complete
MPVTRKFLGIDRPVLVSATSCLLDYFTRGDQADLSQVVVVVPGRRAGRRLVELLVDEATERQLTLLLPVIETVGRLPERLYEPQRPFASELVQRLVWTNALLQTPDEVRGRIMPHAPDVEDHSSWQQLAEMLRCQHVELAGEQLDFAAVARQLAGASSHRESARWEALVEVQDRFHRLLDELDLWDRQTARLVAIREGECRLDQTLFLVGTVDINRTTRAMLEQVGQQVTALVFAPECWADRFAGDGCLLPDPWSNVRIPIAEDRIHVVGGPADQATCIANCVSRLQGRYRADELTIGLADEQLVQPVQRQLQRCGVAARWGPGGPLSESSPYRLLEAFSNYLASRRFQDYAALVRHPDLFDWLSAQGATGDWLSLLDRFYEEQLPYEFVPPQHASASGRADRKPGAAAMPGVAADSLSELDLVWCLTESLLNPLRKSRSVHSWAEVLLDLLASIYADCAFDRQLTSDRMKLQACESLRDACLALDEVPRELALEVSADQAITWVLESVGSSIVSSSAESAVVEMLGWLELPMDDAPVLVIAGVNEGNVPESVNSDLFLPNSLRQRLGLVDNTQRYARDAYAISLLQAVREELFVVLGRRTATSDPLLPSRLLFAVDDDQIAQRTLVCFQETEPKRIDGRLCPPADSIVSIYQVPHPAPLSEPIQALPVTAFRSYLTCPYRFYLRHVLGLTSLDDCSEELGAAAFGTLLHEVLRRFGTSSSRDSMDAKAIQEMLEGALEEIWGERFGRNTRAAVNVQLEQMRVRLRAFAPQQAAWAAKGWRIDYVESPQDKLVSSIEVDGQGFGLLGRIDRVDVHVETGQRIVFDYKSGDRALNPDRTHRQAGQWVDLQLPLYRYLASSLGFNDPVQLGFILLPKDTSTASFSLAEWSEAELNEAYHVAHDIIRKVRDEAFWPPSDGMPGYDEFPEICGGSLSPSAGLTE